VKHQEHHLKRGQKTQVGLVKKESAALTPSVMFSFSQLWQ
jgi:hypothetical protein